MNNCKNRFHFLPILCALACGLTLTLPSAGRAQEKPAAPGNANPSPSFPAAKKAAAQNATTPANADADAPKNSLGIDKDGPDAVQQREEWFYKQRASVHGHIPAGARQKALQHMQQMMVREGKLTQRPDGSFAEVTAQTSANPTWTSIGPSPTTGGTFSPVTGRVTTIAVDPSDNTGNTVLIGGAQGGIWRSTDAGNTWTAVGDQNASLAMGSLAFAPSQTTTVYAGTGEQASLGFDVYYGAGVLKSTDGGKTWAQTCTTPSVSCPFIGPYLNGLDPGFGFLNFGGARISYVAVNPSNPNLILVAAQFLLEGPQEGVYCSSNGGATWTNILPDEMATFVGFASPTVAFAALGNPFGSSPGAPHGNGIYKSTNASSCAATFTALTSGLPAQTSMGRMDLGISPNFASDSTVYASIANATQGSNTNLGVWVTNNGGTSWTTTGAPDVCKEQCWYDDVIKVAPNNKSIAFLGGAAVTDSSGNPIWVSRTSTGGTSWSTVIPNQLGPGLPHVDTHALAFFKLSSGKVRLYLGNDGGIWRTDDAEATPVAWTNLNGSTLALTQFYPSISINSSSLSLAFAGTQDNGSQNFQGGTSWMDNGQCGDGASTAVDAQIPSTVYIGCATGFPVNVSYQNGATGTFSPAVNGINSSDAADFVPPLAADPNTPNVLYFGTTNVYQSIDAGNSWTSMGQLVSAGGDVLAALAVEPGTSKVVYAGSTSGEVFATQTATTDGSPSSGFFQVGEFPVVPRNVTAIAVDPSDPSGNSAYIAYSGFSFNGADPSGGTITDLKGHIFKTTNASSAPNASFTDVSCSTSDCSHPAASDLPNIPVNDLVLDPDVPGFLYAATDLGVYVGNCTVTPCTWTTLGTGLPHVAVLSLRLYEPSRTLVAATHGRGVWTANLTGSFTGPRIFSLSPTSANAGNASSVTLGVTGTGLTGGVVNLGATALTTTVTSDTQISATIPTNLLNAGSQNVTVTIGTPATATSNALPFEILAQTPTLTNCTSSVPAPSQPSCSTPVQTTPSTSVQLTLTGTNFSSNEKALLDGASAGIVSHTSSGTSLTATLPGSLLGPFGSTNDLAVLNTPPGGGKSQPLTFKVVAPPPPNDNFANAINISSLTLTDVRDASNASTEAADPTPPANCVQQLSSAQGNSGGHLNGTYNTIWYQFTPTFSANLEVDTSNSSYDTVLSVWTGAANNLTNLACNDDINPGIVVQSQLPSVALTAGTTYYIMVGSFGPPDSNPIALGGRSQLNFNYNNGFNPTPTVTSVSPANANSGDPSFTLTVNGTNFLNGAVLTLQDPLFQSTTLNTTFVSATQVTATVPASAILFPGNYQILAFNPSPSGSSVFPFTIGVGTYPTPSLNSITPNTIVAGGLFGVSLDVSGTNFALNGASGTGGAVLNFNGVAQPTTPLNHTFLTAGLPASLFTAPGTAQVTVSNPTPGGGASNPVSFTITAPTQVPTITSLSPASAPAGTNVTITVNGTGFTTGAQVCYAINSTIGCNGTNFISSTQLSTNLGLPQGAATIPFYVIDQAPAGTSAPANFTVTGPPDFSFTVNAGQGSQTVSAGQTATFTNVITLNAMNGFNGQVVASCTLPAQATTCAVSPSTLTGGQSANVVVNTTARSGALPISFRNRPSLPALRVWPVLLFTLLSCVLLLRWARTRRQRLAVAIPLAGILLLLLLQATGCGGGGTTIQPPPPPPTGTQAGTYTITVTGTSGSLTHTTTLQLTVN